MVTDASGAVVSRSEYLPFGEESTVGRGAPWGPQADPLNQRFTGKEHDSESGLDYFGARYYGSTLGRFTSPDEFRGGIVDPFTGQDVETNRALPYADITDPQTLNKYAYVRNNPLRYTDPNGHCFWDACIAEGYATYVAVGAIAAGAVYLSTPQGQQALQNAAASIQNGIDSTVTWAQGTKNGDRAGKPFTPKGKQEVKAQNAAANDGKMVCENCEKELVPGKKHESGMTPPDNEAHVDHIEPKSQGGDGSTSNGQLLCRTCNLQKGNKNPSESSCPPSGYACGPH